MTTTSPPDKTILSTTALQVTGNSSGSDDIWVHTSKADFDAGETNFTQVDAGGNLTLANDVYDEFNDSRIDPANWTVFKSGGLNCSEVASYLAQYGTATTGGWTSYCRLQSTKIFSGLTARAGLSLVDGAGNYSTALMLWCDSDNYVSIGSSSNTTHGRWSWGECKVAGALKTSYYDLISSGSAFAIRIADGIAYLYCNGWYQGNMTGLGGFTDPRACLMTTTQTMGNDIEAHWDYVSTSLTAGYAPCGNYTSGVYDTRCTDAVLKEVSWTQEPMNNTGLNVFYRSGVSQDMSSAGPWAKVINGQNSSFPATKRYVQYKVFMNTSKDSSTPVLDDITFTFDKPVTVVEVSIDNQNTWQPATGTDEWSIDMELPENTTVIWVRATDIAGDTNITRMTVDVDTTPPAGGVTINANAELTAKREVALRLNATDHYGIASMMLSEEGGFTGKSWEPYVPALNWTLSEGDGAKSVYVKYRDANGHESPIYSASIQLDTTSPNVSVKLNAGAAFTCSTTLDIELNAVENYRVASMQVLEGDASAFSQATTWSPFQSKLSLGLSEQDGAKTVSARLRDAAGNIGPVNSTTIILDKMAPKTVLGALPANSTSSKFNVSWNAEDATSGVQYYDVQSQAGNGAWTAWLTHTNQTTAQFTGEDLQTYSFRARAQDRAGNLEDFPTWVDNAVTVILPEPHLTILTLKEKVTVGGKVAVRGTCERVGGGRVVTKVEARLDDQPWDIALGTYNWSFDIDTTKLSDGKHVFKVRTYDGKHYSTEMDTTFNVKNAKAKGFLGADSVLLLAAAVAIGIVMSARRKRPGASD